MGSKKKRPKSSDATRREAPDGGEGERTPSEDPSSSRPESAFASWRENIEAFLIAVILAVIIRHFAVEAFEIPTGSMASTLYGLHAWVTCPNCATEYNIGLSSDSSTGQISIQYPSTLVYKGQCKNPICGNALHARGPRNVPLRQPGDRVQCGSCLEIFTGDPGDYHRVEATTRASGRCPICHHEVRSLVIEKDNVYGGHKILVTKYAYALAKPERWDIIVFEFDQWKNYIKRLVGLPGEYVAVWDGDLYIDGAIERKYVRPRVQESLWTKISDSDVAEQGLNPTAAWEELAPAETGRAPGVSKNCTWLPLQKRWSVNALDELIVLTYQRGFDNFYNYNLLQSWGLRGYPNVQVGDVKVAFTVRVEPPVAPRAESTASRDRWIGAEIRDGDFTFQLRIPVEGATGETEATLTRLKTNEGDVPRVDREPHADALRATAKVAIPTRKPTRIEMENVDDRVAVRVNSEEILAIEYTSLPEGIGPEELPPAPSDDKQAHYVHLLASNADGEIDSIQVYRDMYYISSGEGSLPWHGIQLGENEYFAMGDNAPSSSDGRYWGAIPEHNLMGKAFVVFWPAWPLNFQCKFIR